MCRLLKENERAFKVGMSEGHKSAKREIETIKDQNECLKKEIASLKQELEKSYNEGFEKGKSVYNKEQNLTVSRAYSDGYTQALKEIAEPDEDFWDDEDCSENSSEFEGVWESKDNNTHWVLEYDADYGDAVWLKVLSTPSGAVAYHKGQLICLFKEILKQEYTKREEQKTKGDTRDLQEALIRIQMFLGDEGL